MQLTRKQAAIRNEWRRLLIEIKRSTYWPDLAYVDDCGDKQAYLDVTIGADSELSWSYQTGDNSYTGGAYGYPHWAVIQVWPTCNCAELADDAMRQVLGLIAQSNEAAA